jgi:TPR repeat protein
MKNYFFIFFCVLSLSAFANEADCQSIKEYFVVKREDKNELKKMLLELDKRVKENEQCAQNLLGRIYFEGINLEKDFDRAHAIFFELSNKAYPPSQFNLAFVLSKKPEVDSEVVLNLLQGLIVRYTGLYDYGYIALKARDFGREYLSELSKDKQASLSPQFESLIRETTTNAAIQIRNNTMARNEKNDDIMGMLAMGVYGAAIGRKIGTALSNSRNVRMPAAQFNTIQPRMYSIYPAGGNYLYAVPIY